MRRNNFRWQYSAYLQIRIKEIMHNMSDGIKFESDLTLY